MLAPSRVRTGNLGTVRYRLRCWFLLLGPVQLVIGAASGQTSPQLQGGSESEIARARAAIHADGDIDAVRSLQLYGTTRRGFNGVTGELLPAVPVEIRILFPDSYVRIERREGLEQRAGFTGETLLYASRRDGIVRETKPSPQLLHSARVQLARLAFGTLGRTDTALRLVIEAVPFPAAVKATPTKGAELLLELDRESGLPSRIRYFDSVVFPRRLSDEEKKRGVPPPGKPERAEIIWSFRDRRPVSGILLPHRIDVTARGVTFEDTRFERIIVNPALTVEDFKKFGREAF